MEQWSNEAMLRDSVQTCPFTIEFLRMAAHWFTMVQCFTSKLQRFTALPTNI